MQLEESRARAEKVKAVYQQLRDESTDSLRLCVDKCLRDFVMWEVQTLKCLKLDSLKRRLMSMKNSGHATQTQTIS